MITACLGLLLAFAADFNGIWTGAAKDRNGDLQDFSFRFTQNGSAVTGKMYGDNESIQIADSKVDGDQISFTVTTELNGSITKMVYTGTLVNGEIQLMRKKAGDKAEKDKPAPVTLKRL